MKSQVTPIRFLLSFSSVDEKDLADFVAFDGKKFVTIYRPLAWEHKRRKVGDQLTVS
jgi:hypothetical protein